MACLEGLPGESHFSLERTWQLGKLHLNKPQDFWNNVLWTNETKVKMLGHNSISVAGP